MDVYLDNSEVRIKKKKKERKRTLSPVLETVVEEYVSPSKKKKKAHRYSAVKEEAEEGEMVSPKKKRRTSILIKEEDPPEKDIIAINGENKELAHETDFFDGWPKEDLEELFSRISKAIPKNDSLKYNSRVNKLNWGKIKFKSYTEDDCLVRWKLVEKKLRGFRILPELLADAHSWLEKPWIHFYQSTKKNRHPDQPKRPLSSFMLFYMAKKAKYSKKHPNLEVSKLSKIMAEKFKNLPESKKEKYNNQAMMMREEYNEKMLKFGENHPELLKKVGTKVGGGRTSSGPRKPMTPFKMFLQDKIKQIDGIESQVDLAALQAQCKERWSCMSSKKKIPWIRWAHEAENKYLEELKLYSSEENKPSEKPHKSVLSKKERAILERTEGKPEKPPRSAYSLFSRIMLKNSELKEKYSTPKERLQEIARLWKEVPKIEKEEYAEKVRHLLSEYKMEYAAYLETLPEGKKEEELATNIPKKKAKLEIGPPSTTPSKKLKQMTINSVMKKISPDNLATQKKSKSLEELIEMEPVHPPEDSFSIFEEECLTNGLSEKKALKMWKSLSPSERKVYDERLDTLKHEYISNFRSFLTSLEPEELNIYSNYKGSMMKTVRPKEEEEDDAEEEEEEESDGVSSEEDESDT